MSLHRTARELAHEINSIPQGYRMVVPRDRLRALKGDLHRSGWEIVLDNVIGSAHAGIWSFQKLDTGDVLVIRHKQPADSAPKSDDPTFQAPKVG